MKYIYVLLFALILSCSSESNIFPTIKNVSELDDTDFSPTLESQFDTNKNIIYGATIPYAWNEIKNEIAEPLKDFESKQLEEIHESQRFIDVLKEDEYETSVEVDGALIKASAYFRKSLPFKKPLTKFTDHPFLFNTVKVESFGFWGESELSKINYFIDEDNFSISLLPKNQEHEIILIRSKNKGYNDFSDYFKQYEINTKQIRKGNKSWRYEFGEEDKVEIPIIELNLEKSFDDIIGSKFKSTNLPFEVVEFYQQNAFVLNENGAKVKSFAIIATKAADGAMEEELPRPKMMIFDKSFVVFLKKKDAPNPYFGVYVQNEEILKLVE
ncbi:MAG: hypothetical protein ACI94Y_004490 [Maribacter sp.]|jgi:hypothetical protein